jgi:predicted phage terminase large subunit-like protein
MMPDGDARRLFELEREQWHRQCRRELIPFAIEVMAARGLAPALHHRLILSELQALAMGKFDRLLILAPPGSGKTEYVSRVFPTWMMAFQPGARIITASHVASLALLNSDRMQAMARDFSDVLGYSLITEAKDLWHTSNGGQVFSTSVGGTVRGFRAELIIVDDPIKSAEEALSDAAKEAQWVWFNSDLTSRLTPGGKIAMIATPLSMDDLVARLQRLQPDRWRILKLPAFAGPEDPLGRQEGEPLWADDPRVPGYPQDLRRIHDELEQQGLLHQWLSQYQHTPVPPGGAVCEIDKIPIVHPSMVPHPVESVRAYDFAAATGSRNDFTVAARIIRTRDNTGRSQVCIDDIIRRKVLPDQLRTLIRDTARHDGYGTKIWLPQDPGSAGAAQVAELTELLRGYRVGTERMTGSKAVRADPFFGQANQGRVSVVQAPWTAALLEELAAFPYGAHDDQIDAIALGFNKLTINNVMEQWDRAYR